MLFNCSSHCSGDRAGSGTGDRIGGDTAGGAGGGAGGGVEKLKDPEMYKVYNASRRDKGVLKFVLVICGIKKY